MPRKYKPLMVHKTDHEVHPNITFNVPKPKAFKQHCVSPQGARSFTHRTDVGPDGLVAAQERSDAFAEKYKRQGWRVTVSPVYI